MRGISIVALSLLWAGAAQAGTTPPPVIPQKPVIVPKPVKPPVPSAKPAIVIPHIETPPQFQHPAEAPKPKANFTPYIPPYIPPAQSHPAHAGPIPRRDFAADQAQAEAGNAAAQRYVGDAYLSGTSGMKADPLVAMVWYDRAASQGDVPAMLSLGDLYAHAADVYHIDPDLETAFDWNLRAAGSGNALGVLEGSLRLCQALIRGEGAPIDVARGVQYCEAALPPDSAFLLWAHAHAEEAGAGQARDGQKALADYNTAAAAGVTEAMIDLGRIAHEGVLMPRDDAAALDWYLKAAQTHSLAAVEPLAQMYENGWGTAADVAAGDGLHRVAAAGGNAEARRWVDAHPQSAEAPAPWLDFKTLDATAVTATVVDQAGVSHTVNLLGAVQGIEMMENYPARAQDNEVSGAASIACRLTAQHKLDLCVITGEFPKGYGFGDAATRVVLRRDWTFPDHDRAGRETAGRWLHLHFRWLLS